MPSPHTHPQPHALTHNTYPAGTRAHPQAGRQSHTTHARTHTHASDHTHAHTHVGHACPPHTHIHNHTRSLTIHTQPAHVHIHRQACRQSHTTHARTHTHASDHTHAHTHVGHACPPHTHIHNHTRSLTIHTQPAHVHIHRQAGSHTQRMHTHPRIGSHTRTNSCRTRMPSPHTHPQPHALTHNTYPAGTRAHPQAGMQAVTHNACTCVRAGVATQV